MYSDEFQPQPQQNGYAHPELENEEYETEYESDNQFQPETIINPDLSMNGPPTMRSVTPGNSNYGFGQSRPLYDPLNEYAWDTKTMTEEEKAKLKLHQGSVCQFPEKDPRPNYKNELAEYSHVDEFSKYMLPKKTVAQFTEKNPNPNYKNELAEYSHVDEHTKYMIQKPTVAQFQKEVPDYNRMKGLPQKSRIPEEVIYNKKQKHNLLQLHQGSVVQHPRNGEYKTVEKYMAYRPKPDALREEMPVAKLANPNHILPSQVKKMQTYLTHPPAKTIRSIGFTSSAPSSPTPGRKNIWPPPNSQIKQLPRTGFNPNVMYNEDSRKHVWPPTSTNPFGSLNDVSSQPIPSIGKGPAANQWNPDPEGHKSAQYYARFNPTQRLHAAWPPNRTGSMVNISSTTPNSVRLGGDNEDAYIRHNINSSIPLTYRTPPNTQFYNVPYYLSDENNNQLNEKLYQQQQQQQPQQQQQRIPNLAAPKQPQDGGAEENFFDSEQHLDDAELQYQQRPPNQQQFVQLQPQQQQQLSRSGTPSPVNFDAQQFNQQPQDLYSKQLQQQQQLREFERQQAEKINRQQTQQIRSHHLPKQQNVAGGPAGNLSNNLINSQTDQEEFIQQQQQQQQQFIGGQPPQSQPPRAKSPVYRPVSPRNLNSKPPSNQQETLNQQQQIIVQQIPGGVQQQTVQYIQQPTVVKQVHQEQTYREQVEMQKQYYIQN